MGNCATITVTGSLLPPQNCDGTRHCNTGCPDATTDACTSVDPCVANHCAAGCPDATTCEQCGNPSCEVTIDPCVADPCSTGCADATACGKCGNDACTTTPGTSIDLSIITDHLPLIGLLAVGVIGMMASGKSREPVGTGTTTIGGK